MICGTNLKKVNVSSGFTGDRTLLSAMPTSTKEEDPLLLLGPRSHLLGLLPEEGPLLTLDPSENGGIPLVVKWQLSPTEALCESPKEKPDILLSWSDNVLKIKELTRPRRMWSHPDQNVLNLMANGRFSNLADTPRRDWISDIGTHTVWPIGEDLAYGVTKNAVVLYRMIPALTASAPNGAK